MSTSGGSSAPSGAAGGDLSGTYPNPAVAKLQGLAVKNAAPADGNVLTWVNASTDWEPLAPAVSIGAGLGIFGDGSDGTQTFDGSTTILGLVPAANAYTLARDIFLAVGTINNGVSIITNGFRIFCAGTLTNNGTIQSNGNAAAGSSLGAAIQNTNSSINNNSGAGALGSGGGNGQATTGSGGGGGGSSFTFGGQGGAGGAGANAAGAGGTPTANTAVNGSIRALPTAILGLLVAGSGAFKFVAGGTGGGGGGGDGTHAGGGGGGAGGVVIVVAKVFAGTGSITATGGAGGNAAASGTNSGGGGGGGGGLVIVCSTSVSAGAITGQTITAGGGAKGTHLGTGADGSNGNAGTTIVLAA